MPYRGVTHRLLRPWQHVPTRRRHRHNHDNRPTKPVYPPATDMLLNGIGEYVFISQLGHGKFSKVMLARHFLTNEKVAIKIIDKRVQEYRIMSKLAREVAIMQLMDHKNIVRLYATVETADTLYLVMEYVPGKNLDEHLQASHGKLPEDEARHIFRQLIEAIDYCHSHWVVHRDVKTPNVLLTDNGAVKLADFGLSNRFGRRHLRTICGSLLYYSPEIISGQRYYGPEIDCWCLGVSLFRMTAGFDPFGHARTTADLKRQILLGQFPMPDHLSPELQDTLRKCLSVDRWQRISLRKALAGDPWLNDHGRLPDLVPAEPEPSEERPRRPFQDVEDELHRLQHHPIQRTLIYHPIHSAIYFTSDTYDEMLSRERVMQDQGTLQRDMIRDVRAQLQHVQLKPCSATMSPAQSPLQRLWRKIKHPLSPEPPGQHKRLKRTASTLSLSQIYQRVTQDQTSYYSLQSSNDAHLQLLDLVQSACALLGITYVHETQTRLQAVLTLRSFAVDRPQGRGWFYGLVGQDGAMVQSAPMLRPLSGSRPESRRHWTASLEVNGRPISGSRRSSLLSSQSSAPNSRWSRLFTRLSLGDNPAVILPRSQSVYFPSSAQPGSSPGSIVPPRAAYTPPTPPSSGGVHGDATHKHLDGKEGTVVFTIEVFHVSTIGSEAVTGLRFSKVHGSTKAFKFARGWIHGVLEF